MKLKDVNIYQMLPSFMKKDSFDKAFADSSSNLFQKLSINMDKTIILGHIDELNEAELDQLAQDWNVFWYIKSITIEKKRQLLKDAPFVFDRLGTVWAVEKVINEYLPETELKEWFDYNGNPHYFKLYTNNKDILQTDISTFLFILEKIKRKSQWLESIVLELRAKGMIYPACGFIEKSIDILKFGIDNSIEETEI